MSIVNGYEKDEMTSLERVLATVSGKIPDRIPIFPMIDSLPAELFKISIQEYYSSAENVIKGQDKLQELLNLDYVSNFFYLAIESEIFGMKTLFIKNGSPNTGNPIASSIDFFKSSEIPDLRESLIYNKTLKVTRALAENYKGKKPILSVQTGPFSFPSLLMGATLWFESILIEPENIASVLDFATQFGKTWAEGHLEAGADIIVLADGLATATSIPRDLFETIIIPLYSRYTKELKAPVVFYTAGGDIQPFADIFHELGVIGAFPSANDSIESIKKSSQGRYSLFGNINNIELVDWPDDFMEQVIRETISEGKPGGRFALATQHMIPHGVSIEKIRNFISTALKYSYY